MWRQVGIFTLTQNWQHSRPIDGILFRVRHLNVTATQGFIAQCVVDQGALHLFEKQRLLSGDLPDLFEFVSPIEPGKRMIAVRSDAFSTPWRVAIDVYEGGKVAPDHLALHSAHLASVNPHPQYLTGDAFYSALYNKVSTTALTEALSNRATIAELESAIANFVTNSQLSKALADKANSIILTATTTGSMFTEMNTPQRVILKPNSTAGYEIHITGHLMNNSGSPEYIYWIGSGALTRGATAASTVLQTQTAVKRSAHTNGTTWNPDLTADTVNGGLRIRVPGFANKTVKWVASVQLFEVF
jgi:hypothetical protein